MPLQLRQSYGNGKGKTLTHHCALIAALKPTFSLLRRFSTILVQWGEMNSEEAFLFFIFLHFHEITAVNSIKSAEYLNQFRTNQELIYFQKNIT